MNLQVHQLTQSPVDASWIDQVIAMESASYPDDEAADAQRIWYRYTHANEFFVVALASNKSQESTTQQSLVGFVNGTLTSSDFLEEETMAKHDPNGTTLCIHSVVVSEPFRKQRIGSRMLREYVATICHHCPRVQRIVLLAKAQLIGFYISCGFQVVRVSPVVHGQEKWFEMTLDCASIRALHWFQVDAFSSQAFEGNPAVVVMLPTPWLHDPKRDHWMQQIAMENNVSDTAFVCAHTPQDQDQDQTHENETHWDLRWFTPVSEIDLCGHATLATSIVLLELKHVRADQEIHFHTRRSGVLICKVSRDTNGNATVSMDFPLLPVGPAIESEELENLATKGLGVDRHQVISMHQSAPNVLVHLTRAGFDSIKPVFDQIRQVNALGVIVTCEANENDIKMDFYSRFFAPREGINEDPVTGSAHCALANFWSQKLAKTMLHARQQSQRPGNVCMRVDHARQRCLLQGTGCIVLRGTLEPTAPVPIR